MAKFARRSSRFVRKSGKAFRRAGLDFAGDLWLSVTALIRSVPALIALMLVTLIAVTHSADNATGKIHEWARNYPNNAIFQWVSGCFAKTIGLLTLAPIVFVMPKRSYPVLTGCFLVCAILLMPEANFYQYMVLSALAHVFVQARLSSTKLFAVLSCGVYVGIIHHMLAKVDHPSEHFKMFLEKGIPLPPAAAVNDRRPASVRAASLSRL